jgi:hypothetical protein
MSWGEILMYIATNPYLVICLFLAYVIIENNIKTKKLKALIDQVVKLNEIYIQLLNDEIDDVENKINEKLKNRKNE